MTAVQDDCRPPQTRSLQLLGQSVLSRCPRQGADGLTANAGFGGVAAHPRPRQSGARRQWPGRADSRPRPAPPAGRGGILAARAPPGRHLAPRHEGSSPSRGWSRARTLPAHRASRLRRLRGGLARPRRAAAPRGGRQADPAGTGRRQRAREPRGARQRAAGAPGDRRPVRGVCRRRGVLPDLRARPRRDAREADRRGRARRRAGGRDRHRARGRSLPRALARRDPPRRQASERARSPPAAGSAGRRQADRLRRRPPDRRGRADSHRRRARHARLHGARAERGARGGRGGRPLRALARPLRVALGRQPGAGIDAGRDGAADRPHAPAARAPAR